MSSFRTIISTAGNGFLCLISDQVSCIICSYAAVCQMFPNNLIAKDKGIPHHSSRAFLSLAESQSVGGLAKNLSSGFCTPKRGITNLG
jgi:hypothetical protein